MAIFQCFTPRPLSQNHTALRRFLWLTEFRALFYCTLRAWSINLSGQKKKTKKQKNRVPRLVKYLFYLWVHIRRGRFKFKQTFGFSRLYIEIRSRTQSYQHGVEFSSVKIKMLFCFRHQMASTVCSSDVHDGCCGNTS